jgi:hypothetical protein
LAVDLDDGLLTKVFGTFLYTRPSTLPLAGGPFADFVLFFEGNLARMGFVYDPPGPNNKVVGFSDRNPPDGSPFITFRRVPEPDALLLMAASLGALGLVSRRRRSDP